MSTPEAAIEGGIEIELGGMYAHKLGADNTIMRALPKPEKISLERHPV